MYYRAEADRCLVSVIVAAYNAGQYIAETLDSLICQNFQEWDCWIVDDGSIDDTRAIVERYCANDTRFNLIPTTGGNGPYICANIGIRKCTGTYIARLDADDICIPERLELQFNLLESNPAIMICCSEHYNMFTDGRLLHKRLDYQMEELKYFLMFKNPLLHSSMFFRRDWFLKLGMYPNRRLAQDYFIWCYAVLSNQLSVIRRPLVKWRIVDSSITNKENDLQTELALEVNQDYLGKVWDRSVDPKLSLLFFGTFRGVGKIGEVDLIDGLVALFDLESQKFNYRDFRGTRGKILYSLIYSHVLSLRTFVKVLGLVYRHDKPMLYHREFLKLYVKMWAKLWS